MASHPSPTSFEHFLEKGCGRCSLYDTPSCKVHPWVDVLSELRTLIKAFPFNEEIKWGVPVYTINGKNVVSISALKGHCVLSFFDGYLLKDEANILERAGENSRIGRLIRFESVEQIHALTPQLKAYIQQAIELYKSKKIPPPPPVELDFPIEFVRALEQDPSLFHAFSSLTPGRKRGYSLYFLSAKRSETIQKRIDTCIPLILAGKGLQD